MSNILIFCANPDCGELLTIPATAAGREVRCPMCGLVQRVPADAAQAKGGGKDASPSQAGKPAEAASPPAAPSPVHKQPTAQPDFHPPREPRRPQAPTPIENLRPSPPRVSPPAPPLAALPEESKESDGTPAPGEALKRAAPDAPAPAKPQAAPDAKGAAAKRAASPAERKARAEPKAEPVPAAAQRKEPNEQTAQESIAEQPQALRESAWEDSGLVPATGPEWKASMGKAAEISPELKAKLDGRRQVEREPEAEVGLYEGDWAAVVQQLRHAPADLLDQRHVRPVLIGLALLGLVGGIVFARGLLPGHEVLGGYLGAGAGYAAGVLLGLLLVLAMDQPHRRRCQCLYCGHIQRADEEACRACGWQMSNLRTYVQQCLGAAQFGLSNLRRAVAPIGSLIILTLIRGSYGYFAALYPVAMGEKEVYFSVAAVLAASVGLVLWANLLMDAVRATLSGQGPVAMKADLLGKGSLLLAAEAMIALVGYGLPLLTLPILPLLPLRLVQVGRGARLWDYPSFLRQVRRQGQELGLLWLMLLVWLGAMALLELLLVKAYQHIAGLLAAQSSALPLLLQCGMMAVMGVVLAVFLLAAFHCIGLLGRRDREFLQPPRPELQCLLAS